MRGSPILPDIFGDEFDFVETLFGGKTPPDRDSGAANGPALAEALGLPDAPEGPDLPVEAGGAARTELPDVTPFGAEGDTSYANVAIQWTTVSPLYTHAGNHGGGSTDGGDGGTKPDKGGKPGNEEPPATGPLPEPTGTVYFSDNGMERIGTLEETTSGFDIVLEFIGDWTNADAWMTAAMDAADYLTGLITNDLAIVDRKGNVDTFLTRDGSAYWDDLMISIDIVDIGDGGADGILAQASPTSFWPEKDLTTALPGAGFVDIDVDYLETFQASAYDIVLHEFFHVLGFGSLWGAPNRLFNPAGRDLLDADGNYIGEAALAAYHVEFDDTATSIPVEDSGGAGTVGSHWDEILFGNGSTTDLMTGFLSADGSATISDTTLAALEDLCYDTIA